MKFLMRAGLMLQGFRKFIFKIDARILFAGLVIFLFFLNFYTKTFFYGPCGPHQWRQADCLSITKNYYEEGLHFFEPKIHYQGVEKGRAVSECPILNYTVACLWRLFGEHEFIYRLLEYLIYIASMYVFFTTLLRFFSSALLAFFAVSLFLTSPLLAFYSANFIADVPAFSLSVMSFCFFYRFYRQKRIGYFYFSVVLGVLAVLIKASALMGLLLVFFFSLADIIGLSGFLRIEKLFARKTKPFLMLLLSALVILAWYRYALYYNEYDANNIFLLTVLPVWEMTGGEIINNTRMLANELFPLFLNKPMFFLFFAFVIYVIARFRSLSAFLKYTFVFSGLFFLFYLLFFFRVFDVHDYYLINLMFFPMVTLVCLCHLLIGLGFTAKNTVFLRLFLICSLLFNSFHASAIYRLRMIQHDNLIGWFPFVSHEELKLAAYLHWDYNNHRGRIEKFRPVLRNHGIKRHDFVLSIPDQSFNISLYFMDQKGFCVSKQHLKEDTLVLSQFMNRDIKYLIISDTALKSERAFKKLAHRFSPFFIANGVEVLRFK